MVILLTRKEIKGRAGRRLVDKLLSLGFKLRVVDKASRFDRR